MTCPSCGADNRPGARFCDVCGSALASELPREVRKVVTVLFCDVTGSTAMGEQLDPEALRSVMSAHFAVARRAIERHGGTVEKFIGDAVMAVFGVPTVREDDALRAVRAAIELRDAADLHVRIGVNTGEVVTGTGETLVTGDAVNVAARLEQAAPPGEVLIGAETYRLVHNAVEVELVEPIEAKGKSEPVEAYRLVAITGDTAFVRRGDAALVGRERERSLLEDAWARALSEQACVLFTVLGTAGVGKSRLAQEFLDGLDATVLRGRCLSYGEGITYWPVVEVVKQLLGAAPPPNPAIASLLGEGDAPADEIALAVRKLLEAAARERPLVVLLDDLQWGEPTFLDLVEHVTDWSRDAPILVLCLARPDLLDSRPSWGGGKLNATTVLLEPLTDAETDELIERLLGAAELELELREQIRHAAGGNPLFVEQMLAMVQESSEAVTVPPTIQALLAARLDQLPRGERAALERGAVEGQVFHRGAVQALMSDQSAVPTQLMGLVRKELVRPTPPAIADDDAFRFRHLLVRDAAYDSLPKATRAELHERFAAWMEEHGADLVELDEILGYHLEQAARCRAELGEGRDDLADRAAVRLAAAGMRAFRRTDYTAGRKLLGRAVALLPEDAPTRFDALLSLGICAYVGGDLEDSDRLLTEAVDGGDREQSAAAYFVRAGIRGHTGGRELGAEVEGVEELLAEMEALPASELVLAHGYHTLSRLLFWQGRTGEQLTAAENAVARARAAGDPALEALARGTAASAMFQGTSTWAAVEAFGRASLAERDRLGRMATNALATLANAAAYQGRFDESRGLAAEHVAELAERGDSFGVMTTAVNRAWTEHLAGDHELGAEILRASWEALGERGERGFRSTHGCLLAMILVDLGRLDEAESIVEESALLAAEDDWFTVACAHTARALIASARGRHEEAAVEARAAVEIADRSEYVLSRTIFWFECGRVLVAAGLRDEGRRALEEAIRLARIKGTTVYEQRALGLLEGR